MNKRNVVVFAVVFALVGAGYFVYSKYVASGEKVADTTREDAGQANAADTKKPEQVPPPLSPQERQVSMDDDPEGPLRLEGQVIDENGAGVGGAMVTLSSNPPRTIAAEDDGTFAFDKLVGRTYSLSARSGALVGGPIAHRLTGEAEPAIIRMRTGGSVTVTVVAHATGKPVAGATVQLREGDVQSANTDADGKAVFDGVGSGWFVAAAHAPGYGRKQQGLLMPSTPGAKMTIEMSLERGVAVSGTVTGDGGKPVSGATVLATGVGDLFGAVDPRYDGVKTDDAGAFRLEGVAVGKVRIYARHPDYSPGQSEIIELTDDLKDVAISLDRGGLISGRVIDEQQQPVPWAGVSVVADGDGSMSWGGRGARGTTSDGDGKFEIKGLARAKLSLLASSEAASSEVVAVDLAKSAEVVGLDVILSITGTISGKVVDGDGNEVPEVQVVVYPDWTSGGVDMKRAALNRGDSTTTAGDGSFKFSGLPDGTFMLKPTRDPGSGNFWQTEGKRAKTGDKDIELLLPNNGSIKGSVVTEQGVPVSAFTVTVGWPPGHPFADGKGAFELSSVPPGKYDLKIRGAEFAATTVADVEVKADETADVGVVKVIRGRTLTGRVVDSGGSGVAGAQVVMARQLVGSADAISFSSNENTDELMGIRRGTTDGDGRFRVRGIPLNELVVAAEEATKGRSRPTVLPKGGGDAEVTLKLRPTGTVLGTVKRGDVVSPGVNVLATPSEARMQMVMAQTDDKGGYALSRLSEGSYEISAIFGGGMSQQGMTRRVEIKGGDEHRVDLVFEVGNITLNVRLRLSPTRSSMRRSCLFFREKWL